MSLATPTTTAVRSLSAPAASRLLGAWHTSGPVYLALADALRSAVLAGSLAPLTRLPSERELARALGVSRTTTSAAYARLRELGFATSQVGSGTVAILPRTAGLPLRPQTPAGDGPLPPLADGVGPIEMSQATPSAPDALHGAYERALEMLPAYLGTGGYAHLGLDVLREAVAARYRARGVPTTPDQILVTTGGQQAIALLATTLVSRTEPVVVESPTYYHAIEALQRAGARVIGVPTGDVESLASAVHRTRARLAYLVPDFHNPTGRTLTADERDAVVHLTDRYGVTVVGDETLTDLDLEGGTVPGPFCGDGTNTRLVSVGSASKSFWGGIRIGWVRATPQLVQRLARTRQALDIATPVLEQLAVVELLARRDEILPARVAGLRERRDLLVGLVRDRFPDWDVPVPKGGLCLWTGIGRPAAQALTAAAVAEGLRIGAGPQFTPDGTAQDRIRLIYTATPETLAEAVERLARAWRRVTG
ncbi:PLP-dependent aminotransferase family protein [Isoptericola sp. S6320L]|uniref:MocR-like transcription factor YczR n=1 Tax=Isoptericola sp. S6320L TaxID=2926411 RepID=UPI001FF0E043|nr:PLP-dependent aminotransferase family protein [Isoptericola sp. S6320L]MCK0118333.1 PLP-dependent aminotransferase family protein [Isoptericola sp. S6320L]